LSNEDVVVAKVNCDGEGTNTGRAEGVTAYPTIKFYPRHSTQGEEYPYARNEASITDFLRGKIAGAAPPPVPISSKPSLPVS
jgi:protein disulfide-isomerase A6